MTVRHRQRKGAKSGFFLYAREKAFSKPPAFSAEVARRFPAHGQITLHAPQAFSASFRPSTAPLPAFFAAKRGFFAPNARRTRLFARPNTPVLPRLRPFLPGAHPDEAPACPGFARDPGARAHPRDPRKPPRVRLFCPPAPASARRAPPERPKVAPPAAESAPPCAAARPLPPPAARRSARRPAEAQPWGWQPRLPRSAFPLRRGEVCAPRGGSDPWA